MKKLILFIFLLISSVNLTQAQYKLDNASLNVAKKYNLSQTNLHKEPTRSEFVESLYTWYKDYKAKKGIKIDYSKFKELDNTKVFTDIDLKSDFGKKLSYFASIGAFAKNEKFNPNSRVNYKTFFIVMKRLRIMYSLSGCKNLNICEKESDNKSIFNKGVYYRIIAKILDKNLRKHYYTPQKFIELGYKPYLSPSYRFPILGQTLNGCYAFAVRNIFKYKYGIGIYVAKVEKYIKKPSNVLWTSAYRGNMYQFDKIVKAKKQKYYTLETFITALQNGEPLSISYLYEYTNRAGKKVKVGHVVAAYSFDSKGIWIAETVSNRRIRIPWDKVFNKYGRVKRWRIYKYFYIPKTQWTEQEINLEKENNFITREF